MIQYGASLFVVRNALDLQLIRGLVLQRFQCLYDALAFLCANFERHVVEANSRVVDEGEGGLCDVDVVLVEH